VSFENAIYQWDEGRRRLHEAPSVRRAALERVTDQIVAELRRRLGGLGLGMLRARGQEHERHHRAARCDACGEQVGRAEAVEER